MLLIPYTPSDLEVHNKSRWAETQTSQGLFCDSKVASIRGKMVGGMRGNRSCTAAHGVRSSGGTGWIRTSDTAVMNRPLYP